MSNPESTLNTSLEDSFLPNTYSKDDLSSITQDEIKISFYNDSPYTKSIKTSLSTKPLRFKLTQNQYNILKKVHKKYEKDS